MEDQNQTDRRNFLRVGAIGSAAIGAMTLAGNTVAGAVATTPTNIAPTPGDIAILQFLCAAEQIETDLWEQYAEMGEENPFYREALQLVLDPDIVIYASDTHADELSHDQFIAAYLTSIGVTPVDLTPFKTIPSPNVIGGGGKLRLTNLTQLTLDTSYYTRYHNGLNPDFDNNIPQLATITGQSAIPTKNIETPAALLGQAGVAGLHFAAIEQGGSSLYNTLLRQVASVEVLEIVSSIYATEAIHFAIFNKVLEHYPGFNNGKGTLVIPDLTNRQQNSAHVMATPTTFLRTDLPLCSVIRPATPANSGAVASATGLVKSGLFTDQSQTFFDAVVSLATAADAATRPF
jgi:hypothetical protein